MSCLGLSHRETCSGREITLNIPNPSLLRWAHRLTIIGLILLIVVAFLPSATEYFSTPRWVLDLAYSIPLLVFVFLVNPQRPKSYAWLCFVILIYFCKGVLDAFTWPAADGYYGIAATLLTAEIFLASMMATRWAGQTLARTSSSHA